MKWLTQKQIFFAVGYVVACLEKREAIVLRLSHQSTCFYLFGQILDLLQLWHVGILKYFRIMFHFVKVIQSSQRRTNRLLSPLQICLTPMSICMDLRNSSKLLLRSLLRLVSVVVSVSHVVCTRISFDPPEFDSSSTLSSSIP
jgi:hypothetical protein